VKTESAPQMSRFKDKQRKKEKREKKERKMREKE